jgi:hypothetical protein
MPPRMRAARTAASAAFPLLMVSMGTDYEPLRTNICSTCERVACDDTLGVERP